jgi:hypothetical protein
MRRAQHNDEAHCATSPRRVTLASPRRTPRLILAGRAGTGPSPMGQRARTRVEGRGRRSGGGQAGAQLYSITSSARRRNDSGIVSPSAFAVLRLTTNSNLVGCTTGRSAGFSPLRIRPI